MRFDAAVGEQRVGVDHESSSVGVAFGQDAVEKVEAQGAGRDVAEHALIREIE